MGCSGTCSQRENFLGELFRGFMCLFSGFVLVVFSEVGCLCEV